MNTAETVKEYVVDFYSAVTGEFKYSQTVYASSAGAAWNAVQKNTAAPFDRTVAMSIYCASAK